VRRPIFRVIAAAFGVLSLAACVDSSHPILTDSQPLFGAKLRLQLYTLRDGHAVEPDQTLFTWDGKRYVHAGGGLEDVADFTVHPFEGNYIIQDTPTNRPDAHEFALMRKLASGVYLVRAINEDDADAATRAAHCGHAGNAACRVETQAQLFALARASAARRKDSGGLVIRLPDRD
jgi:hypothetical protein